MSGNGDHTPIIIKRRKAAKHGHHSSAWKIALADFMCALMATFLVLWLTAQATPEQREGIADYFSSPVKIAMVGGEQSSMSSTVVPGGGKDTTEMEGQQVRITPRQTTRPSDVQRVFFDLMKRIRAAIEGDDELRPLKNQVVFEIKDEGLEIRFQDSAEQAMFNRGSDELLPQTRRLMATVGKLLAEVDHPVSISGHTDATQYSAGLDSYSNWELSADRANASRRVLMASGLPHKNLVQVVGLADTVPVPGAQPHEAINRRIAILVYEESSRLALASNNPGAVM